MIYFKLLIPFLVFITSPAPDNSIDSLVDENNEFSAIDKKLDRCFDFRYSNPDSALYYGRSAIRLASEKGYSTGKIRAHLLLGILHDVGSQYDSALYHYRKSLSLSHDAGDTLRVASSNANMGLTYFNMGNFREAMDYFLYSLGYFKQLGFSEGIASTYNNLGMIYIELEDYEKSLEYYQMALEINKEMGDEYGLGAALTNIGNVYNRMDSLDFAIEYINRSISLKDSIGDKFGLTHSLTLAGGVYIKMEELEKAGNYLRDAIRISKEVESLGQEINAYLVYQSKLMMQENYHDAIGLTEKALKMGKEIGSLKFQASAYKSLSRAHEALGDIEKSFEYYKKHIDKKDELVSRERMNQVFQLELEYEREKSASEIALLNRQAEISSLQIEKQQLLISRRNSFIVAISTLFLVFVLLAYVYYMRQKNKEQLKLNQALSDVQKKVSRGAIEAEIKERQRIGEELHDSFGQILSLIKLNLTKVQKMYKLSESECEMMIGNTVELANKGFVELRDISHNMSPMMLKTKGLVLSVKDLLDRIEEASHFDVNFEVVDMDDRLEPIMEFTLFRIIQELLNNIIKHAKATEVTVQMVQDNGGITIMMEDNGQGFHELELKNVKGMGLKNAFSRIKNLNGEMDIDSAKGRGTIINISVPFEKNSAVFHAN